MFILSHSSFFYPEKTRLNAAPSILSSVSSVPTPAMSFVAACAPPLSTGTASLPSPRRNAHRCFSPHCAALRQSSGEPGPSIREQAEEQPLSRREWRVSASAALAAVVIGFGGLAGPLPAAADLNKYEADVRGEFGIGSAAQFGSADLKKAVHTNENFRRANFTSADMRESDFSGSTFNGAYLEKAVAYKANFTGADFSDTLMDRMVLNEANLTNAVLVRSVLTRSDLGGAIIEGADFSDAVLDLTQKQALCKYASGTNPTTGVSTRLSLGCGNSRRNAYGSPSSPLLSKPPQKLLDRDGFCDDSTGMCDMK